MTWTSHVISLQRSQDSIPGGMFRETVQAAATSGCCIACTPVSDRPVTEQELEACSNWVSLACVHGEGGKGEGE